MWLMAFRLIERLVVPRWRRVVSKSPVVPIRLVVPRWQRLVSKSPVVLAMAARKTRVAAMTVAWK